MDNTSRTLFHMQLEINKKFDSRINDMEEEFEMMLKIIEKLVERVTELERQQKSKAYEDAKLKSDWRF